MATNGLLLDMDRAHDVLRDSTFVRFNLNAGDTAGFKRIHQSSAANFDLLVEKIKGLVEVKRRYGYDCTIRLQMVLIPENFDQVMKLGELGTELGVEYLQVKQCSDTEYGELGIDQNYARARDTLMEVEKLST